MKEDLSYTISLLISEREYLRERLAKDLENEDHLRHFRACELSVRFLRLFDKSNLRLLWERLRRG
jgi:hypothetical protein